MQVFHIPLRTWARAGRSFAIAAADSALLRVARGVAVSDELVGGGLLHAKRQIGTGSGRGDVDRLRPFRPAGAGRRLSVITPVFQDGLVLSACTNPNRKVIHDSSIGERCKVGHRKVACCGGVFSWHSNRFPSLITRCPRLLTVEMRISRLQGLISITRPMPRRRIS